MSNPPPKKRIFLLNHPNGLQVQKRVEATTLFSSERVSATRFWTYRPNGWLKKVHLGGNLRKRDLTHIKDKFLSLIQGYSIESGKKGDFFAETPLEGFSATCFWTCRPNGWLEKKFFEGGNLRKGD